MLLINFLLPKRKRGFKKENLKLVKKSLKQIVKKGLKKRIKNEDKK